MSRQLIALVTLCLIFVGCANRMPSTVSDFRTASASAESPTDSLIRRQQSYIVNHPGDARGYNALGMAYAQKGRETGDLDWYVRARDSLREALKKGGKDPIALRNFAYVSTIFHDFGAAVDNARKAIAINTIDSFAYGVLTDSYLELGQYERALEVCQKMIDIRPDAGSYARASRLRYVYGDIKGATLLMHRAASVGGPFAENTAWCNVQLGDLCFKSGGVKAAEQQYKLAQRRVKDYRHAEAGLARISFAQGEIMDAVSHMEKATTGTPSLTYIIELGDLYERAGRKEDAARAFAQVDDIVKAHRSRGIEGEDLIVAMYLLDHNGDKRRALDLVEHEISHHKTVEAYAILATAYSKVGRHKEALDAAKEALRTNVQDALIWHRLARVHEAAGEKEMARRFDIEAESLNPKFSFKFSKMSPRVASMR